jgi:hypothetical protein
MLCRQRVRIEVERSGGHSLDLFFYDSVSELLALHTCPVRMCAALTRCTQMRHFSIVNSSECHISALTSKQLPPSCELLLCPCSCFPPVSPLSPNVAFLCAAYHLQSYLALNYTYLGAATGLHVFCLRMLPSVLGFWH